MRYLSSKITVPYPTLLHPLFNDTLSPLYLKISFSIQEALELCPCTQTHNILVWIPFWRNILPPFSESLLKKQTVNSSETLLPRLHVTQTLTILCLLTTVKPQIGLPAHISDPQFPTSPEDWHVTQGFQLAKAAVCSGSLSVGNSSALQASHAFSRFVNQCLANLRSYPTGNYVNQTLQWTGV